MTELLVALGVILLLGIDHERFACNTRALIRS